MAANPFHGSVDPDVMGVHVPFQYSFADSASRTGAPASMLLGGASKLALQRDNMSLWLLTSVSPTPTWQQIGGSNLATGGSNIGTGIGAYDSTVGQNLQFRSLLGGYGVNVTLQSNTSSIVVTASAPSATNLGAGASLYHETAGSRMQFKSLLPGDGIDISADASGITIQSSISGVSLSFLPLAGSEMGGSIGMQDNLLERPEIKDYSETLASAASSGSTYTIDLELGNVHKVILNTNATFSFVNPPADGKVGSFSLVAIQSEEGGKAATWPAGVLWASGIAPTLTAAPGASDIFTFFTYDGGNQWFGFLAGGSMG